MSRSKEVMERLHGFVMQTYTFSVKNPGLNLRGQIGIIQAIGDANAVGLALKRDFANMRLMRLAKAKEKKHRRLPKSPKRRFTHV